MAVTLLEELVENILERLPAKSLMRFKSVKRSWNALFKTNTFVWRHSQRQRESNECFMIAHFGPHDLKPMITLLSSNHPTLLRLPQSQCPFLNNYDSFLHCNGVICLCYFDSKIDKNALWNPSTREFKLIPPSLWIQVPTRAHNNSSLTMDYKGFGADPNTFNEFKLIQFHITFQFGNDNYTFPIVFVEVYNTSTNSWIVLPDVNANDLSPINKLFPCGFRNSAFSNGGCHWLSNDYTYILCFDFRSNLFRTLDTPTTSTLGAGKIFEVDDSVAYAIKHSGGKGPIEYQFDIWILTQDSSWTKKYNIGPFYTFDEIYGIWKDGAEFLLGSWGKELVSYNSNGEPLHWLQPLIEDVRFKLSIEKLFDIHKYVESIAPLSL